MAEGEIIVPPPSCSRPITAVSTGHLAVNKIHGCTSGTTMNIITIRELDKGQNRYSSPTNIFGTRLIRCT